MKSRDLPGPKIRIFLTSLAFLALLLATGLFYWLPTRNLAFALRPSPDIVIITGLTILWPSLSAASTRFRRWLLVGLTLLIGLAILLGIAQTVAMREFGYQFMLAYHSDKIKALFSMMYDAQSLPVFFFYISLLAACVALVLFACYRSLLWLFRQAEKDTKEQRGMAIALAAYLMIAGLSLGFNSSISAEIGDQFAERIFRAQRMQTRAYEIERKMNTVPAIAIGNPVKRPTVLVFVVESYGQVLLEAEKYKGWHKTLSGHQSSLTQKGYFMRSTAYRAPVFGGSSWLANATILCRFMVQSEKTFKSLFKANTKCLPTQFNEAGYQTVFAASNTTKITPEYTTRFPFENFYPRDELSYKGPRISWSYMPDQYVIDVIEKRILSTKSVRPRFVYYKLTSSHHPWDTIPPYLEDWSRIGDGTVYNTVKMTRFPGNEFLGGKLYNEGYLSSVEYSMETVVGYLNQMPPDRHILAIVLGDHQPRKPVADIATSPWTVPLHIISRDKELVERFSHEGYTEGLFTTSETTSPGLELFAGHLFSALGDVHRLVEESMRTNK